MTDLQELIERREIDIRCWHCSWTESRTLSWISVQRHMTCPTCSSVIVLDSSELRREISRQRKQLEALHGQMVNLLQSASKISRRAQLPSRMTGFAPKMDLALARSHPNTLIPALRPAAAAKRLHR
jgi:DNA-directed RNA polymerase subunit RPC12/RpoP